ncbi:Uncharacterised protein [Shigella sonnei]|nr:Uncharacterised protein [Shigella sonnei]CSP30637.1 Uncharacterised protein [Shigella sonnei]
MLLNFLRQQRHRQLQFVLHLNLRDIRISTRLKGQGDLHGTRGVTVRGHVHQVIDTVHILFDNLCHRVLHCFRISAGVGGGDRYCRRCNRRILRHRQFEDRQPPCQHDDNGDHPRKNRAIDKEIRHVLTAPV